MAAYATTYDRCVASRIEQVVTPPALWVHSRVYTATRGWIGHRILGVPCLLLHSVGAKSGAPRTHALTYAKDGDAYVVVASKSGAPTSPAWLHNVRKQPDVDINVGPRRVPVRARVVNAGDTDYPRLWKLVNDNNRQRYAAYQRRTSRPIPLVVLSPR